MRCRTTGSCSAPQVASAFSTRLLEEVSHLLSRELSVAHLLTCASDSVYQISWPELCWLTWNPKSLNRASARQTPPAGGATERHPTSSRIRVLGTTGPMGKTRTRSLSVFTLFRWDTPVRFKLPSVSNIKEKDVILHFNSKVRKKESKQKWP